MSNKVPVTEEGLQNLRKELDELVNVRRPEVVKAIALAREEGDLRENAGYDAARHDQMMIERRIRELEDKLRHAEVIDSSSNGSVQLGSKVSIEIDGETETYTIVGAVEAKPAQGKISNESPIGSALLGSKVGDDVEITTPATTFTARVISIDED
ncbi:MAG: transcription elongation factor GreA [Chloroflexota bacterium]